jgi:hypothetical protein
MVAILCAPRLVSPSCRVLSSRLHSPVRGMRSRTEAAPPPPPEVQVVNIEQKDVPVMANGSTLDDL